MNKIYSKIKRLFLKFWPKKKEKDFPIDKAFHREQLLQALAIVGQPEFREYTKHSVKPLLRQIIKEFN